MLSRLILMLLGCLAIIVSGEASIASQSFVVSDYLNHRWTDEPVHFDFDITGNAGSCSMTDANGVPIPCQFTDTRYSKGRTKGIVWTVVSVEPNSSTRLFLKTGRQVARTVTVKRQNGTLILSNDRMAVLLPQLPGKLMQPVDLRSIPAPLRSLRSVGGKWLGGGKWINTGPVLRVVEASTSLLENGPVRVTVRQTLKFVDGRYYHATIQLVVRQDAVMVSEDTNVDAPKTAFRFSMQPGLAANRLLWHNQGKETDNAKPWELTDTRINFDKENVVCSLRPWSFWWEGGITEWAGFYQEGKQAFVGVLALRPSHWSPDQWDGFEHTAVPVTAGPNGRLDLSFGLLATKRKTTDGKEAEVSLHREWALTVGTLSENQVDSNGVTKLRRQLIKYSEFPLDEVKDYAFNFAPTQPKKRHPCLILMPTDVARVRRQAKTLPSIKEQVDRVCHEVNDGGNAADTLNNEGWEAFYDKRYLGNYRVETLPSAYMGSGDPLYSRFMAAAVKGIARDIMNAFLEKPTRPAIGAYGPWQSELPMRLLLNYDLIAGSGFLTQKEEKSMRSVLVFSAHVLAHPDYWNSEHGLCSANPNMTSSIRLPQGLLGLYLEGHPDSKKWQEVAEKELKRELAEWIKPGGAWVENSGYQYASLDGIFLLAQAIRNMQGRDYFADPKLRATMEYYGFLLTPPDPRFPQKKTLNEKHPMVQPSIGDMFSGFITCFNGWMAAATARTDPAYSARQQFYWKSQGSYLGSAGRAKGFTLALTDPDLPAAAPVDLSCAFPGFGSLLRTSWTDSRSTYVAHRTGPNLHHYHDDFNSIVLYAKGAPLCTDFGNCYEPVRRDEAWYHNCVSFNKPDSPKRWGPTGELVNICSLPDTLHYSYGKSSANGRQEDHRHILLVKSADPMGANYVVMRDITAGGQPNQDFYWNLWCLSEDPEIAGSTIHFPGQFGVDLDIHVLSPVNPYIEKDQWEWKQGIYVWGDFAEKQYGVHISKQGASEDYLTVLYPRTQGQAPARVSILDSQVGAKVEHSEGVDFILLSPGKSSTVDTANVRLRGEIAFARIHMDGTLHLAVVKGEDCAARFGDWELSASGPVAVKITDDEVTGESDADAHTAALTLPRSWADASVLLDGKQVDVERTGRAIVLLFTSGYHRFVVKRK